MPSSQSQRNYSRRNSAIFAAAVVGLTANVGGVFAVPFEVDWAVATGDYNTAANWSPAIVPYNRADTSVENPFVDIGILNSTGHADINGNSQGAFLNIGMRPNEGGSLTINSGTVILGELRVGGREIIPTGINSVGANGGGTGSVLQKGGDVRITYRDPTNTEPPIQSMYLGDAGLASGNTANGTYEIQGGTLVSGISDDDSIVVGTGVGSTGTFIQSGTSTVTSTGFVTIARRGAHSSYSMSGGNLNVGVGATTLAASPSRQLNIGDGDTAFATGTSGTFTQTGGVVAVGDATVNQTQNVEIGRRSGTGVYDISAGSLTVPNGGIVVGGGGETSSVDSQKGNGTLHISGTASVLVSDSVTDGVTANNTSRGNMSIGSASVAGATNTGLVKMDGGLFTFDDPAAIVAVGNGGSGNISGNGTLEVNAGTFAVSGATSLIDVGRNGSTGLVKVTGSGIINTNEMLLNSGTPASGTVSRELRVSGGTVNVNFWEMGGVAPPVSVTRVVNISGGAVNVNGGPSVASRGGKSVSYKRHRRQLFISHRHLSA